MTVPTNCDLVLTRLRELLNAHEALEHQGVHASASQAPGREDQPLSIRALSITQPWASLIMTGHKRVETRNWEPRHRGPLAIHAAKTFPGWARDLCLASPFFDALTEGGGATQALRYPLVAVVAVAELVDVRRITSLEALGYVLGANEVAFGDWTPGRCAWLLANVRPLAEPIPARGEQGLWHWAPPADLAFASRPPA